MLHYKFDERGHPVVYGVYLLIITNKHCIHKSLITLLVTFLTCLNTTLKGIITQIQKYTH